MNAFPPAGWYPDGSTPGVVRWFDGSRWTEHTAPDPSLAPAPAPVQQPVLVTAQTSSAAPAFGSTVPVRIGQSLNLADRVTEDADYQHNRKEDALRLRRRGFGMYFSALAVLVVTGCVGIAMGGTDMLWWAGGAGTFFLLVRAWRDYDNATYRGAPELTRTQWILAGVGLLLAVAVYIGGPVIVVDQLAHLGDDTTL